LTLIQKQSFTGNSTQLLRSSAITPISSTKQLLD